MKQDLQQELKEKIKEGVKPSDLKRLKRSKSADDIPSAPPLPSVPLNRSKSSEPFNDPKYPYTTLISQSQELETLRKETQTKSTTISLLRKKISELEQQPSNPDLDNSLISRHQNLKSWFTQYQKAKQLDKELAENVNEASQELINQDKTISQLRSQLSTLKQTNQSLHKDLQLAQRAVAWRQTPFSPLPSENLTYLQYALYSLAVAFFMWWLIKHGLN